MIAPCDSCTDEKPIKAYLYAGIVFYWCNACADPDARPVAA
jgi:hypothetical protein